MSTTLIFSSEPMWFHIHLLPEEAADADEDPPASLSVESLFLQICAPCPYLPHLGTEHLCSNLHAKPYEHLPWLNRLQISPFLFDCFLQDFLFGNTDCHSLSCLSITLSKPAAISHPRTLLGDD